MVIDEATGAVNRMMTDIVADKEKDVAHVKHVFDDDDIVAVGAVTALKQLAIGGIWSFIWGFG